MHGQDFQIKLNIAHRIRFTHDVFSPENTVLKDLMGSSRNTAPAPPSENETHSKLIAFIDQGVADTFPKLENLVREKMQSLENFTSCGTIIQAGGEGCKKDKQTLLATWDIIENKGIDRHSYILCIGGGAYLDVIGMAAATAHRGIRLIRFPTTTLSQDDSGVGVKNGINAYGKKNFLGTFSIPYAVVNDFTFLHQQPERDRRAGLIEAVKVALVKDAQFFTWIESHCQQLATLEPQLLEKAVKRSALLHAQHISYGGDPFETGNNRPLDFGHWSAHKIEQLTDFSVSHAEAVSIGIMMDTLYAWKSGMLSQNSAQRIFNVIKTLKLPHWHPCLEKKTPQGTRLVYQGLEEFREHLGGELTLLLLREIGIGENVHSINLELLDKSINWLKNY